VTLAVITIRGADDAATGAATLEIGRTPDRSPHRTGNAVALLAGRVQAAAMDRARPDRTRVHVRQATLGDVAQIKDLAVDNAMFGAEDLAGFDEMLTSYFDGSLPGHQWIVAENSSGAVTGAAYYAPEPFADRVWNLYFLAVRPDSHRTGIGHTLITHVEHALRTAGDALARVLIVETSSTDPYQPARRLYAREGFTQEAVIREFYGPGDHKVTFWRQLHE